MQLFNGSAGNSIQLFNGSAGNRLNYFAEGNKTLWFFTIQREKLFDLLPALPLNNRFIDNCNFLRQIQENTDFNILMLLNK